MRTFIRSMGGIAPVIAMLALASVASGQTCSAPVAGSCQNYNNALPANAAFTSNNGYASDISAGFAQCAEEFYAASAGNLNAICFAGRYNLNKGTLPGPTGDQFQITIFGSAGALPDTTTPLAGPMLIGADLSGVGGQAPTAGTSLTRSATALSGLNLASTTGSDGNLYPRGPGYVWTATFPNIAVAQYQHIWVEIFHSGTTDPDQRWRWLVYNGNSGGQAPDGNGACNAHAVGAAVGGLNTAGDLCMCVNVGMTQPPVPNASNADCGTAAAVTPSPSGLQHADASVARGGTTAYPFCKAAPVSGRTYWYNVTGDGTTFTASTCFAGTNLDTVIGVYCGDCAALNCVASNDTGPATCTGGSNSDPSLVSWPTASGVVYHVTVFGFNNSEGIFDLNISSDGIQAATHPACASDRCPINITGIPAANFEQETCGTNTNLFCFSSNVVQVQLGQTYVGETANSDDDWWELAVPMPNAFLAFTVNSEAPTFATAYIGDCLSQLNPGTDVLGANTLAVVNYCTPATITFQTDSGGKARFRVDQLNSRGLPCGPEIRYSFSIALAPTGSCCQPFTVCQVLPQANCVATGGSIWSAGGACSPTDPCQGVCCTGTTCVVSAATDCTAGGTTYIGGGTCTPNSCAPAGVCCRGATCNTTITSAAACTGSGLAGAVFATGSATCNSGAVSSSPCCYANYNKVNGVSVQDIFDFLSDWFAGNAFANTGGTGAAGPLSVQNIFDFLTNWFNGGCS